ALEDLVKRVQPRLITIGGSLNLFPHPVREIRQIADTVGAKVLFDAAHQCGMIAGRQWPNPLQEGAHLMTMSTYKSLGGSAGGLIVSNEPDVAKKLEAIAFPGLTANFDVAKSAALAITMLDWQVFGQAYAATMVDTAQALAVALDAEGAPVFTTSSGFTSSHQFALQAETYGGGQHAAKKLRNANILSCGIGLPVAPVAADMNGLRFGTPEIVRRGMLPADMQQLASLVIRALQAEDAATIAAETARFRCRFQGLAFIRQASE
ncbi:MAG TPA: serine hydroxymethyltransferase, partial [Gammaproteobacteria bacterium]|nr:serine hydroxymethyltransferase [Gammaproteobacteria bacterium]